MNVKEFKKLKPEFAHLEGEPLWEAMTVFIKQQKDADETIQSAFGFFKQYKPRKLFYLKYSGQMYLRPWQSNKRCRRCRKGVTSEVECFNEYTGNRLCPNCQKPPWEEPNKNLSYLLWKKWSPVKKAVLKALNWLCIVGDNPSGRYGMFGDESKYVIRSVNFPASGQKLIYKPRRWWEYIFVKR
jgi:hypothetical protein